MGWVKQAIVGFLAILPGMATLRAWLPVANAGPFKFQRWQRVRVTASAEEAVVVAYREHVRPWMKWRMYYLEHERDGVVTGAYPCYDENELEAVKGEINETRSIA